MRDYVLMRHVLATAAKADGKLSFSDIKPAAGADDSVLEAELERLDDDGLLDADLAFSSGFGERARCSVSGLTGEGREFYKLIENDKVWEIVIGTLKAANVDISYPLLKEVCEDIVKRYVVSFIPDIPSK